VAVTLMVDGRTMRAARRGRVYAAQSSPGIMRRMNASNSGTVNAVSP
jgi:hypothetical protein